MVNTLVVTIKNTPILRETQLAKLLEEKLSKYRKLKDLRLLYLPNSNWVSGEAKAFFDLEKSQMWPKSFPLLWISHSPMVELPTYNGSTARRYATIVRVGNI
jgi:hypothetical protein